MGEQLEGGKEPTAPAGPLRGAESLEEAESRYNLHRRFDRMARLVGEDAMERLHGSKVMVVGLGGVGSFAAESLARSGVGHLMLVDFDRVCTTNTNRQLQAMKGEIGRPKADVLTERLGKINSHAKVEPFRTFYTDETSEFLLSQEPDYVVDAIDNITAKCHLLQQCRERGVRVVCSTGASGRIDPTAISVADLSETRVDPLAAAVRKILRQRFGFPRQGPFDIPAVYSVEPAAQPRELTYDGGLGFRCVCPGGKNPYHSCEERSVIYGTTSFITGTFGFFCASVVVREICSA